MRRILPIMVVFACLLAGCGGAHQHRYTTAQGPSAHSPTFGLPPKGLTLPQPASLAGTQDMFDSVSLASIQSLGFKPFALAGYTAGYWPTYLTFVHAYPQAHVRSVAIRASYHAHCLDIEPGDAVPSDAAGYWQADRKAGFAKPCFYANLSTMPQVRANLSSHGISRSQYLLWVANWTFVRHLDAGYDATQWTDRYQGHNVDASVVTLDFLGITPPPPLPKCFTHQISKAQCDKARAQVKAAERGAQQSLGAYQARGCDVLKARERWFADAIKRQPHSPRLAYRKGALAATKRAEQRQQCQLFTGRVDYFLALENRIRAAN